MNISSPPGLLQLHSLSSSHLYGLAPRDLLLHKTQGFSLTFFSYSGPVLYLLNTWYTPNSLILLIYLSPLPADRQVLVLFLIFNFYDKGHVLPVYRSFQFHQEHAVETENAIFIDMNGKKV
jgi:hypothetical protein